MRDRGVGERGCYAAALALEELLSNVIRHGYGDGARHEISVRLRAEPGGVELELVDDGREFDPSSAPEVDLAAPLEDRSVGGLGIHLVRRMARDIRYERTDGRNRLRVSL